MVSAEQSHMTILRAKMLTHRGHVMFLKFSADQLLAFHSSPAQVYVSYGSPLMLSIDLRISSIV